MRRIDLSKPVMVTGATGYVAGRLIETLLSQGIAVHAAVRDPQDEFKMKYLRALSQKHQVPVVFFQANLLQPGSYQKAMQGCEVVFHTASPFAMNVSNAQKDLVEPALMGTRNVLGSVNEVSSVKRVVLTSSCAAIYGDNVDLQKTQTGFFSEQDWNTTSSLAHQPYSYSKTLAEKEAWKIVQNQKRWDLVTINPSLVIGPGINPQATSESHKILAQFGDGQMKIGVPRWGVGVVDVREVAQAHLMAAFTPAAKGRYIVSAHDTDFYEMAQALLPKYGKTYPIPRRALPKWLVWLVGPLVNGAMTRQAILRNVDYPWRCDNQKAIDAFGLKYRGLQESMEAFFEQMVESQLG